MRKLTKKLLLARAFFCAFFVATSLFSTVNTALASYRSTGLSTITYKDPETENEETKTHKYIYEDVELCYAANELTESLFGKKIDNYLTLEFKYNNDKESYGGEKAFATSYIDEPTEEVTFKGNWLKFSGIYPTNTHICASFIEGAKAKANIEDCHLSMTDGEWNNGDVGGPISFTGARIESAGLTATASNNSASFNNMSLLMEQVSISGAHIVNTAGIGEAVGNSVTVINSQIREGIEISGAHGEMSGGTSRLTDNKVYIKDTSCDTNFKVYGAFEKGTSPKLFDIQNNEVHLKNSNTPNAELYGSNLVDAGNPIIIVKNNKLFIESAGNKAKSIANFDHLCFDLSEVNDTSSSLLTLNSETDLTKTNSTKYQVKIGKTGETLNESLKSKIMAGNELVLLTCGSNNLKVNDSTSFSFYNDEESVSLDKPVYTEFIRDGNGLVLSTKDLIIKNQANDLVLFSNNGSTIVPSIIYRNTQGRKSEETASKEVTLSDAYKSYDEFYGFKDDLSNTSESYTESPDITMIIDTDVDLRNTSIHGSNNPNSNSTLKVAIPNTNIKSADLFNNYVFELKSDYPNNTVMLSSTNAIDVDGATINSLIDSNDLPTADKIILMNNVSNAESANATYKINGDESVLTISEDNKHFINVSKYSYDTTGNQVAIVREFTQTYAGKHNPKTPEEGEFVIDSDSVGEMEEGQSITEIYGVVSDNGVANGANVDVASGIKLDNIDLIGGKSEDGSNSTEDNAVNFKGHGAEFKGVSHFENYNFTPNAETAAGSTMLATTDAVDLGKEGELVKTVNVAPQQGFVLNPGEKVIIMNKTEHSGDAKLLLDGVEAKADSVVQVTEGNRAGCVQVNAIGYVNYSNSQDIEIENKESILAAYFCNSKDEELIAENRAIKFDGNAVHANVRGAQEVDVDGIKHVYGYYTLGNGDKQATTIEIHSNENDNKVYHGGFDKTLGEFATGHTLLVSGANNKVKGIMNFENLDFVLPTDIKNGNTMLAVKDNVDLTPTNSIKVTASGDAVASLKGNDDSDKSDKFVNLLTTEGTIQGYAEGKVAKNVELVSFTTITAKVDLTEDNKALKFSLKNTETPVVPPEEPVVPPEEPVTPPEKPVTPPEEPVTPPEEPVVPPVVPAERANNQTKAPVEAVCAASALVESANDLVAGDLSSSMATLGKDGLNTFAALKGGKTRYHSGSHIDSNAWNIGVGIGKKGLSKKNPNSTYGVFFSYGKSDFDTFNDGFVGNGKSKASALGLMFHSQGKNNYYYNGSAFIGKVKTDWNSILGGYNDDATFRGFNLTLGHKYELKSNKVVDTYAKYMFSHTNAMNAKMGAYEYNFDAVNSSRLRLGFRVELGKDATKARPFYGLAYEHEFNGEAKANMNVARVDSPSLKGDTGILEVGYKWTRGAWDFNFTVEGTCGKRQGVTGSFNAFYNF